MPQPTDTGQRRVKIVHLIDDLSLSGTPQVLCKLLRSIDTQRFENIVITLTNSVELGPLIEHVGVPVHPLGMTAGKPSLSLQIRLARLLRRLQPDLLQTWLGDQNMLGAQLGKLLGIKVIWNLRHAPLEAPETSRQTQRARAQCVRCSEIPEAMIVCSAKVQQAHVEMGYCAKRWVEIPNGFDTTLFAPNPDSRAQIRAELGIEDEDVMLIGWIGRNIPVKDAGTLLAVARLVTRARPRAHFVLAGSGCLTSFPDFAGISAEPKLMPYMHLLGPRTDIAVVTAALDIATMTSLSEGFPNVIGEAMACGVPCVVTETAGEAPTLIGETGLLAPPHDPRAFADALLKMIDMGAEARRALGAQARERIIRQYTLPSVTAQYEALYQEIAGV